MTTIERLEGTEERRIVRSLDGSTDGGRVQVPHMVDTNGARAYVDAQYRVRALPIYDVPEDRSVGSFIRECVLVVVARM